MITQKWVPWRGFVGNPSIESQPSEDYEVTVIKRFRDYYTRQINGCNLCISSKAGEKKYYLKKRCFPFEIF